MHILNIFGPVWSRVHTLSINRKIWIITLLIIILGSSLLLAINKKRISPDDYFKEYNAKMMTYSGGTWEIYQSFHSISYGDYIKIRVLFRLRKNDPVPQDFFIKDMYFSKENDSYREGHGDVILIKKGWTSWKVIQ